MAIGLNNLTIHIASGPSAWSDNLSRMLERDGCEVKWLTGQDHFAFEIAIGRFDCVLIDTTNFAMSRATLSDQIKLFASEIRIIVVADSTDFRLAVGAMKDGAFDVVEKSDDFDSLLSVLRDALILDQPLPAAYPSFAPSVDRDTAIAAAASLTDRQRQILGRILRGQPNKIIAADLGISQRTAENHRAAIMKKYGVSSVAALVQTALVAS